MTASEASRVRPARGSYRTALHVARAAAVVAPRALPAAAARVRRNLHLAFGRADDRLVRGVFRHFAEAAVDLLWFDKCFDPSRLEDHFFFEGGGLEHWRATRPGAAVFVTGHFGNWELFGAAFRHVGIPLAPVARPPDSAWFARRLDRFRRRHGQRTIPKANALPLALKALRGGQCVAFLVDQAAGRHGIDAPFFGRLVRTFTAPAALAAKAGVPLYAGYSTRLGDGIAYRCFAEHVPFEGGVEEMTCALNARLESYVRAAPEQWWWFHRRFKACRSERRGRRLDAAGLPVAP